MHSERGKRVNKFGIMAIAALATLGWSGAANAFTLHDHLQVKVGVATVNPDEDADVSVIGGDVNISNEVVPTVQLEWFFTDHISAELLCCVTTHDVYATGGGGVDLGSVTLFPPTVTVKYRWNTEGKLQPYLGAGVNYTHFFNEDEPSGTTVEYDDSWGPALQVGADYRLNDRWSLNLDARRLWINTDVTVNGAVEADVDINPWVVTAAVGYRF